jgi:hypothetical protein
MPASGVIPAVAPLRRSRGGALTSGIGYHDRPCKGQVSSVSQIRERTQGCLKVFQGLAMEWGNDSQCEHPRDVVGHLPEALTDGAVTAAAQQVHRDAAQEGEHWSTRAVGVAMGVLTELGVTGPVPLVFNAPVLLDQSQQGTWVRRQRRVEPSGAVFQPSKVAPDGLLTDARRGVSGHFHDPGAAGPVQLCVLWRLFRTQFPERIPPVILLVIRCGERDPALSLELAVDLAVKGLQVGIQGQEGVDPSGSIQSHWSRPTVRLPAHARASAAAGAPRCG